MDILKYVLLVIGIICLGLLIWGIVEPRLLKIKREEIRLSDSSKEANKKSICDLRVFYFSDLHVEFCFIPAKTLCELITKEYNDNGLDAVIFGGDITNNPKHYQRGANYLNTIALTCNSLGIPFLGVNGNHDILLSDREINYCGFNNISNSTFIINKDSSTIGFMGVKDSGRHNRIWPDLPSIDANCDMTILLAHNPDYVLHFKDNRPDFVISGHIHGGQIRTPINIEFTVLRKDELPKKGVIAGLHEVSGTKLYISQGIGCVLLPFRICARPEVNILHITK